MKTPAQERTRRVEGCGLHCRSTSTVPLRIRIPELGVVRREPPSRVVVALSGPIRAGKSTLADSLAASLQGQVIRTRDVLENEYASDPQLRGERRGLQRLGEQLDRETGGEWVVSAVRRRERQLKARQPIVIDALRIPAQLDLLRKVPGFAVTHIYLTAPRKKLEERYGSRDAYEAALESATERNIAVMSEHTYLRLNTGWLPRPVVSTIAAFAVRLSAAYRNLRRLSTAFLLGCAIPAICLAPVAWFAADWTSSGTFLLLLRMTISILFVVMAVVIGIAVTHWSPIERDRRVKE